MRKLYLMLTTVLFMTVPLSLSGQGKPPARALENWQDLGFGMFIHWGPVSQTGYEITWSRAAVTPVDTYDYLYRTFNPEKYDPERWAKIADEAGMKYVIITTKHHDGFCLWPSDHTDYDIEHTPYKKDVIGALAKACRDRGIKFGTYYSVSDFHHPEYPKGSPRGRSNKPGADLDQYISYYRKQTRELVNHYDPFVMWYDIPQIIGPKHGKPTVEMLRRISPNILINDRAYNGFSGDFTTAEWKSGRFDRSKPWERPMPIGTQWAWKPKDHIKSKKTSVRHLLYTVGGDGNFLFNVGPRPDGRIHPPQAEILRAMGTWIEQYGNGIYNSRGGPFKPGYWATPQNWGVSTARDDKIFLFVMDWSGGPANDTIKLPAISQKITNVRALTPGDPELKHGSDHIRLTLDREKHAPIASVIELTVSGNAVDIEPKEVPGKRSLSYRKPARASNVYKDKTSKFGPSKAVDGNHKTRWATDGGVKKPWIQINLQQPTTIDYIQISEAIGKSIVLSHSVEYLENGEWKTLYQGDMIGPYYERRFDPVNTSKVRIRIHDSTNWRLLEMGPRINEILLR